MALAVFLFLYAETFVSMPGVPYGPKLFPQIISSIMGAAALLMIISGVKNLKENPLIELADWAREAKTYVTLGSLVGGVVFYILAANTLGFLLTAVLMLAFMLTVTRGFARSKSNAVIAIIFTILIFTVFFYLLRVPLPIGTLERLILGYS